MPKQSRGFYGARRASLRAGRGVKPSFRRGSPRNYGNNKSSISVFMIIFVVFLLPYFLIRLIFSRMKDQKEANTISIFSTVIIWIIVFYVISVLIGANSPDASFVKMAKSEIPRIVKYDTAFAFDNYGISDGNYSTYIDGKYIIGSPHNFTTLDMISNLPSDSSLSVFALEFNNLLNSYDNDFTSFELGITSSIQLQSAVKKDNSKMENILKKIEKY